MCWSAVALVKAPLCVPGSFPAPDRLVAPAVQLRASRCTLMLKGLVGYFSHGRVNSCSRVLSKLWSTWALWFSLLAHTCWWADEVFFLIIVNYIHKQVAPGTVWISSAIEWSGDRYVRMLMWEGSGEMIPGLLTSHCCPVVPPSRPNICHSWETFLGTPRAC